MYPAPIQKPWIGTEAEDVDLETKRRRLGRFIGLRVCESPMVKETPFLKMSCGTTAPIAVDESISNLITPDMKDQSVREMVLLMEREWEAALAQAQAEHYHSFGWK